MKLITLKYTYLHVHPLIVHIYKGHVNNTRGPYTQMIFHHVMVHVPLFKHSDDPRVYYYTNYCIISPLSLP